MKDLKNFVQARAFQWTRGIQARLLFFQRVCNTTCFLFWLVWYLQTVIYQWALSWNTLLYETKIMHLNPAVIRSSIGQSLRDFHNWRLSLYLFPEWERYNQMYTLFFLLTEWKQLLATLHGDLNMVNRQLMVKTSVFYTNNRQ